jgi:hypothetical protein
MAFAGKWTIAAWRGYFEKIASRKQVQPVEHGSDRTADGGAILDADASRLVDIEPDYMTTARAHHLAFDAFHPEEIEFGREDFFEFLAANQFLIPLNINRLRSYPPSDHLAPESGATLALEAAVSRCQIGV